MVRPDKDLILTVHFSEEELYLGHLCETMLKFRLNFSECKILLSYENNGNTWYNVFISNCALFKTFKVYCDMRCKSTKVKALGTSF
jgi:hypothetical protein